MNRARGLRRGVGAALLLAGVLPLAGCGGSDYCGTVSDQQEQLTRLLSSGSNSGLLQALPILQDLRSKAPADISDEWQQFIVPLQDLHDALDAAGIAPADYDPKKPPSGLSEADRTAIQAAATSLGSAQTVAAFASIQQEVLDVCHTPLAQ